MAAMAVLWHQARALAMALVLAHIAFVMCARPSQYDQTFLRGDVEAPVWPESYTVEYTFTLTYTAKIQPDPISYPVVFYRDAKGERTRMDTYNGTNVIIATKKHELELVPRIDKQICVEWEGDSGLETSLALPPIKGWNFAGSENLNGQVAHLWRYTARHQAKEVDYRFYVAVDGTPLRLWMHGNDVLSGSHFDEWVVDYHRFVPGRPPASVFDTPKLCKGVKPWLEETRARASALRASSMLPRVAYRGGDAAYDAFLSSPHGAQRRHRDLEDYRTRAAVFGHNAAKIKGHNARADKTYTMAMNRFGDWHDDEFLAVIMPKAYKNRYNSVAEDKLKNIDDETSPSNALKPYELPYEPKVTDFTRLPTTLSWRDSKADAVAVKDQAACGSCWAFGATGAMEAAWFMATGEQLALSEQEVMDCSWGVIKGSPESSAGCDGGDAWAAIIYAIEAGGLSHLSGYQYKGQDGYCESKNVPRKAAAFRGWTRVPRYNASALMEAVYSRGPLAISMDAAQESFRFYSSGVYAEPSCKYKPGDLDHSMMLEGYGTSAREGDYWLVRNSWSDHWGDKGYIKVSRDNHGCGIVSDAVFAVADVDGIIF